MAPNVNPGMYTVKAEAKGFQALEHANVLVEVGQNIRVDLTLQPGEQTQTVTVSSEKSRRSIPRMRPWAARQQQFGQLVALEWPQLPALAPTASRSRYVR